MELLLLTCHNILYAMEMRHVSRIIKISSINNDQHFLYKPANEEFGVLLTNNRILPVDKVERMIHHEGNAIEANDFLKGCMPDTNIDGFVAIDHKVYGMLGTQFIGSQTNRCPAGESSPAGKKE